MSDVEFKLEGIEELVTNGDKLILELGPIVRDLLDKSIKAIERKAKRIAPVDTGRLRSSISSQVGPGQLPTYAEVGTNVNYARFVEFGTKNMKAQPYLIPAFEQSKPEIDQNIQEAIAKIEGTWSE
jgi:HK97 gp10 family phage protein